MLKHKIALNFLTKLLIYFSQFVIAILIARKFGPNVVGLLAYSLSFANLFAFIPSGFGSAHIKLVASSEDLRKCVSTYFFLRIVSSLIGVLLLYIYIIFYTLILNNHLNSIEWTLINIYSITFLISNVHIIISGTFEAKIEQIKLSKFEFSKAFANILLKLIVIIFNLDPVFIALTDLMSLIFPLVLFKDFFKEVKFYLIDRKLLKTYVKLSLPVFLWAFSSTYYLNIDKILLKEYASPTELGYYVSSFKFAIIFQILISSLGNILFPFFTKALSDKNYDLIFNTILKYQRNLILILLPLIGFTLLFSDSFIILLLGKNFYESIAVYKIIIIGIALSLYFNPYANLLSSINFKYPTIVETINLIIFIISTLALFKINVFSPAKSVSFSYLLSSLTFTVMNLYLIKKFFPSKKIFNNLNYMVPFLINLLIFLVINEYFLQKDFYLNLFISILYIINNYFILILMGRINKNDIILFLNSFSFETIKNFLKNENQQ